MCYSPSQRVAFDGEHPRLILSKKGGQHLKIPHISIMRKSRTILDVSIPMTEEQTVWVAAKEKELKQQNDLKNAPAIAPPTQPAIPKTPEDARSDCRSDVKCIVRFIEQNFRNTQHAFSNNSMDRIKNSIDALLNAVTNAQVVKLVPKYERVGNIIQFPQRAA